MLVVYGARPRTIQRVEFNRLKLSYTINSLFVNVVREAEVEFSDTTLGALRRQFILCITVGMPSQCFPCDHRSMLSPRSFNSPLLGNR